MLPLTDHRQIVLVRQFRPGPDRQMLSLPGGLVDPGEQPEQAARRELAEETGWAADRVDVVATIRQTSTTQRQHVAIARGCRPAGAQRLDPLEDCQVVVTDVQALRCALRAAEVSGTHLVYTALDHAGLL